MSNPWDPYGHETSLGQTSWGTAIREANELSERQLKQIEDSVKFSESQKAARAPVEAPPYREPVRQLSPEDRAERARRNANRQAITKEAPFFKRLTGHVLSYLDKEGNLLVNSKRDLANGEVVPKHEHLRRLAVAYRNYWEARLEQSEQLKSSDPEAADKLSRDAVERLQLLGRGKFLAPVNRQARELTLNLYRRKTTFFGTKLVRNSVWKVRIADYDRRLRKYVDLAYEDIAYRRFSSDKKPIASLPAEEVFEAFLRYPHTLTTAFI